MNDSKRIADLRVSKMTIVFVRYVYPAVILWALCERRRNQAVVVKEPRKLGRVPPAGGIEKTGVASALS